MELKQEKTEPAVLCIDNVSHGHYVGASVAAASHVFRGMLDFKLLVLAGTCY